MFLLGTAGLGLLGGGLGYLGQKDTNEANVQMSREQMDWQTEEAVKNREFQQAQIAKQMGFQERMSSSAVQRRMADMKASGINPILAGKYEASTPAGAAGSGAQGSPTGLPRQESNIAAAMAQAGSAVQLMKGIADTDFLRKKTSAIKPAAELGDAVETIVDKSKGNIAKGKAGATSVMRESQQMADDLKDYLKGGIKKLKGSIKRRGNKTMYFNENGQQLGGEHEWNPSEQEFK